MTRSRKDWSYWKVLLDVAELRDDGEVKTADTVEEVLEEYSLRSAIEELFAGPCVWRVNEQFKAGMRLVTVRRCVRVQHAEVLELNACLPLDKKEPMTETPAPARAPAAAVRTLLDITGRE